MSNFDSVPFSVDPLRYRSIRDLVRFLRQVVVIWRCALPHDFISIHFRVE